jgi:hypothetical protein
MRLVASPEAEEVVRAGGGRLFVWSKRVRCCGITFLQASTEPPDREFRCVETGSIEVYLAGGFRELPGELHVELRGRRGHRHLEAYWNGCAYVA